MPPPSEPLLHAFGAAVRELRVRRGISQEGLASEAGLQRTYLNEVERGRRNVTLITIGRIAEALGVGVGELVGATEAHTSRAAEGDT